MCLGTYAMCVYRKVDQFWCQNRYVCVFKNVDQLQCHNRQVCVSQQTGLCIQVFRDVNHLSVRPNRSVFMDVDQFQCENRQVYVLMDVDQF